MIVNAGIVFHQPAKLALHTGMSFVNAPGGFEDESLRRMKPGKIRRAAGRFGKTAKFEHSVGLGQKLSRLIQKGAGLLLHRSMPSMRIAYISGMRGSL
ncbi:MAG TPA: hypothetical protein VE993_14345 [Stellaceae bacterium]|nr:hypothetical protein [Stellaceae bacterium]